jgi:hypothetical protein
MPSKVRILHPPHQQERPLASTNMVRGRSSSSPVLSGRVRWFAGGCALYLPKFRKYDLGAGASPGLELQYSVCGVTCDLCDQLLDGFNAVVPRRSLS